MAEAERHGRVSPAILRSHFNCWLYSYSDVVHGTYNSQAGYTWRYSNNFNFLREVEPSKFLNCSHHLSAGTEAVLNSSFKSASKKLVEASITLDLTGIWQTISRQPLHEWPSFEVVHAWKLPQFNAESFP